MMIPALAVLWLASAAAAQPNMTEGSGPISSAPKNGKCGLQGPGWSVAAIENHIRDIYEEVWNAAGIKGPKTPLVFGPYDAEKIALTSHLNFDVSIPDVQIVVYMTICDIAHSDDELAAILGHELGHVELRHIAFGEDLLKKLMAKTGECDAECEKQFNAAAMPKETDADMQGIKYLLGSRFKAEGAIYAMRHAKDYKWARGDETVNPNHPPRTQRAYELSEYLVKVKEAAKKP